MFFIYKRPRVFTLDLIICQRLHDVTVNRSLDLLKIRTQVGDLEESIVPVEVHSELQKKIEDSQTRVQESKVSSAEDSMKHLREDSDEKLRLAKESEDKLRSELERTKAKLKAESKAKAVLAAKVKSADEELEGIAIDAVYLVWTHNRSMDLSFLEDPSVQARFETRLSAKASAAAQARQAASEGRVPNIDPVVEIEAEVPPTASNVPAP